MTAPDHAQLTALLAALDDFRATVVAALAVDQPQSEPFDQLGPLASLLASSRTAIVKNPSHAAGVVHALSGLGRRHATTPEGAALLDRITASPEITRLREVWESVTLNLLDEVDEPSGVPAAWLDLILDGLATEELSDAMQSMKPAGFA